MKPFVRWFIVAWTLLVVCSITTAAMVPDEGIADIKARYDAFMAQLGGSLPQNGPAAVLPTTRVNCMPKQFAFSGESLTVWGNANADGENYQWDFGDGNVASGNAPDGHYIKEDYTYNLPPGDIIKTYIAKLTLISDGAFDEVPIAVVDRSALPTDLDGDGDLETELEIATNIAIEDGLEWLYLAQWGDGSWSGGVGWTGFAVLAFENQGYLARHDWDIDIYAEYIQMGLNFIFQAAIAEPISVQPAGDPDILPNGQGIYFGWSSPMYETGIALMAIAGTGTPGETVGSLGSIVDGWEYAKVAQDVIDFLAWAQNEDTGSNNRGGWRYWANYGDSDNSVSQWPTIGLEAIGSIFGPTVTVPNWVKGELAYWATYIQNDVDPADLGGSGYNWKGEWDNIGKTGALLAEMRLIGPTATPQPSLPNALAFMDAHWLDTTDESGNAEHFNGNLYAMYGAMKGFRLMGIVTTPGGHNWYLEYADFLVNNPLYGQQPDGSWPSGNWLDQTLSTAAAILILSRQVVGAPFVFIDCPPDITKFPKIKLAVKVDTNAGNSGNLTQANFEVAEDGAPQTIDSFSFDSGVKKYMIAYTTTNPNPDGTQRAVLVRVTDPDEGVGTDTCFYKAPLFECGNIEGFVTDCLTGRPLDHAVIGARNADGKKVRTVTDSKGYYKLTCLEPGSWVLVCRRICYCLQIKLAKLKPGETIKRDFLLKPGCCEEEDVDVFELLDNYPNPSNPETWIPYRLPEDADVTIRIYNATGQLVRTLNLGRQSAGAYIDKNKAAYWDGRTDEGSKAASGVYFYTLQAGKYTATRKMTLLK
jgi:hypothetical protein